MTYSNLFQSLYHAGFTRIERDDRLLDIFPDERREKGIELWERWDDAAVLILQTRIPFSAKKLRLFRFPRQKLEGLLLENQIQDLNSYQALAAGEQIFDSI